VLEQLKERAFMAWLKNVQVLPFKLPGEIKNNNFLGNITGIFAEFKSPLF